MFSAFAYSFCTAILRATGGKKLEYKKYVGPVLTIMRLLAKKDEDLKSYFDKVDEAQNGIKDSSLNQILFVDHLYSTNRGKVKGHLNLEVNFRFRKTF